MTSFSDGYDQYMAGNTVNNVEIPEDLRRMCGMVAFVDPESEDLFPPEDIALIVNTQSSEIEDIQYLSEWLKNRDGLWERSQGILAALPGSGHGDVPEWVLEPWAIPLGSQWGRGLLKAITEAEAWLAEKST